MKKILFLLLLSLNLYADAQSYLGVNYGYVNEDFSSADAQISSQSIDIKAGYGVRKAYAVEIYLSYVQNRSKIFSSASSTKYDGDKYALNVAMVKSFDFGIYILPFVKAGFGAGFMKVNRTLDDKISFGSFNLDTGFYLPLGKNSDLEFGYRFKSFSFEGLDLISKTVVHTSNVNAAYLGINFRY